MDACKKGYDETAAVILGWAKTRYFPSVCDKLQLLVDSTKTGTSHKHQRVDLDSWEVKSDLYSNHHMLKVLS